MFSCILISTVIHNEGYTHMEGYICIKTLGGTKLQTHKVLSKHVLPTVCNIKYNITYNVIIVHYYVMLYSIMLQKVDCKSGQGLYVIRVTKFGCKSRRLWVEVSLHKVFKLSYQKPLLSTANVCLVSYWNVICKTCLLVTNGMFQVREMGESWDQMNLTTRIIESNCFYFLLFYILLWSLIQVIFLYCRKREVAKTSSKWT